MTTRLLILASLLLLPSRTSAEPLKIPLTIYAASAVADFHGTLLTFQHGGHEVNPMYAWLDRKPVALGAVSALVDVASIWALHRWIGKKHPKIERIALYASAANRLRAAYKGYRIASQEP